MKAIDTNVLIHAHREEMGKHTAAKNLLRHLAEGAKPWGLPIFCIGEFIRVVTHRRVFNPPTSIENALGAINALAESPSLHILYPDERYLPILFELLDKDNITGNLVFDAAIAALCLQHGVETLISEDRDLKGFTGIKVISISYP